MLAIRRPPPLPLAARVLLAPLVALTASACGDGSPAPITPGTAPDSGADAASSLGPADGGADARIEIRSRTDGPTAPEEAGPPDAVAPPDGGDPRDASHLADGAYLPGRPEVVCASADPPAAPRSTTIDHASVESADSVGAPSTGDLWPSCWSGDALYAAWGDGFGFSDAGSYPRPSIGVARITGNPGTPGTPGELTGETLVHDSGGTQAIFKVWTGGSYYQKPTGMLCAPGQIFLAVQDLDAASYGDAPAATIAVSTDSGRTWTENRSAPMFDRGEFTTVMFLDYGQDGASAVDGYLYVYGLDYNWRYSPTGPSPQGLYLARVAGTTALLDRTAWEYFGGNDASGDPTWVTDFGLRLPVLVDCARRHATATFDGYTVISQGGVVYDAPQQRYLYTSWSEYTFEFYESPTPWGPWRKFLYRDFGLPPWTTAHNGGYGTSIPSKFLSADGDSMWLQSNTFSSGVVDNNFELRTLSLGL